MSGVGHDRVELQPAALDLLDRLLAHHEVGAGLLRFLGLVSGRHHEHLLALAGAVRQHDGAAHHLVGVPGVDAETERDLDRLVELGVVHVAHQLHRLAELVAALLHLRLGLMVLLRMSHRPPPYATTSMPMLRAVPSMIRIAASSDVVLRSGSLVLAIASTCALCDLPDLVPVGLAGALLHRRRPAAAGTTRAASW